MGNGLNMDKLKELQAINEKERILRLRTSCDYSVIPCYDEEEWSYIVQDRYGDDVYVCSERKKADRVARWFNNATRKMEV